MSAHPADTAQWMPVVGYEGKYEVSDQGLVRSLDRLVSCHKVFVRTQRGRVLSAGPWRKGYLSVCLADDGKKKTTFVHHLVLEAFVGPRPSPDYEGCHNNGDRLDNRAENLRWDTASANQRDKVNHGRNPEANKTHCPRGHSLAAPNLVVGIAHRKCQACSDTHSAVRRRGESCNSAPELFQRMSDEKYARIMSEVAA